MIQGAVAAAPEEACGVVAGGCTYSIPNVAKDPKSFFAMDMAALIKVYEEHGDIEAVWHSHPGGDPLPSETDWNNHPPGKSLIIVANGQVYAYSDRPS